MQGETETNRTQQIEDLCDPCTRFFVNKKLDTITDGKASDEYKEFARFVESLPAVCAKNANGQRCGLLADENAAGTSPLTAIGMPLFTPIRMLTRQRGDCTYIVFIDVQATPVRTAVRVMVLAPWLAKTRYVQVLLDGNAMLSFTATLNASLVRIHRSRLSRPQRDAALDLYSSSLSWMMMIRRSTQPRPSSSPT